MKKTSGIVMKTSKKVTILYTESGDYLEIKTPKGAPTLGQVLEIELPEPKPLRHRLLKFGSVAAILLLALSLSVFNFISGPNTAVAAVVIDMDSSIELLINRDAKVLKAIDVTQRSGDSPANQQLQGMDLYTAVDLIIDRAHQQGVFNQANPLILTSIIPLDDQPVDVIDQGKLRESIERHMRNESISANMMVIKADEITRNAAQSLGMSVNHYQIYKRIQEKGLIVTTDGSNSKDTHHMLAEANTTLLSLFPKESMIISPPNGMHEENSNSMGNSMTGESTPTDSSESGSNQSLPNKADESTSSGYTMPGSQHESGEALESIPTPMQGNLDSSEGSGEHQMMR
ncbi:anti-sigma factor domain-containing protein [Desulfosporosinus lacus]|uniref:Anti-sigma factor N-terminus n=1 Tax=Desulfosporosinus lacus DSM 15449 TaxID=1121420 RepID=A0A1M5QBA1_9FIRM|nr:anti-sigma factor domain-containing protein [Desulfosporosinus lacus]SHH11427.1 Anti-sigma factor N-terminus [Desulfosporosinus lacus DSM 15449]